MITIASSLFECKRALANPAFRFLIFLKDTNPRNQQQPLNTTDFRTCIRSPHPLIGRPGGRPTPSTGRPGDRPGAQQRVGYFQSVDRAVDRALPCARCAHRSTEPVDRVPNTAGGRLDRSTDHLHLLLFCCCAAASFFVLLSSTSLAITRRPSTILVNFPISKLSLFNTNHI